MDDNNRIPFLLPITKQGFFLSELEDILYAYVYAYPEPMPWGRGRTGVRLLPFSFSLN